MEICVKYYLLQRILDKYETSQTDWRGVQKGIRSVQIKQEDYDCLDRKLRAQDYEICWQEKLEDEEELFLTGRECLLKEVLWLQQQKLIKKIKWVSYNHDIDRVHYPLENIHIFYELTGRTPKFEKVNTIENIIKGYAKQAESEWLLKYYQDQLIAAIQNKKTDYETYEENLYLCLNAMEKLEFPVYTRIFSSNCLHNSKVFERKLKNRVISIAKKYHPTVDEEMEDYQVLEQLYLDTYSQELAFKGALKISLEGKKIDFTDFVYGAVLNSDMLKKAELHSDQSIHKIITVENKANYMSIPYEKDVLVIFSHGFFSPLEREFLKKLEKKLEESDQGQIEYYHTGDLDYGGVRIFQYIRKQIFPKLQPWQMSAEQYERYKSNAIDIEETALEKLKRMKEPLLQELIEIICREEKVIEQESFLYDGAGRVQ